MAHKLPAGTLVTRSEARAILAAISDKVVVLDMSAVENAGQGFADEMARSWLLRHPERVIEIHGCNDVVAQMLRRATSRTDLPQAGNRFSLYMTSPTPVRQ